MSSLTDVTWLSALVTLLFAGGALLRRKHKMAHYAAGLGSLALAVESLCTAMTASAPPLQMVRLQELRLVCGSLVPGAWLWFSLAYARGNAVEFLRRWGWTLAAVFICPLLALAIFGRELISGMGRGGLTDSWVFGVGAGGFIHAIIVLAADILVIMNLERTYRAAVGTVRWRVKFMLMGVGLLFAVRIFVASETIIFRSMDLALEQLISGSAIILVLFGVRSYLRSDQAEVQVYPSRSVLQGSFTIVFAGVYLMVVGGLTRLLASLGGNKLYGWEAIVVLLALALLVTLLQSDRLRVRLERFLSRHFERPLYDYRTVWRRYIEITAAQTDRAETYRALVKLTADVFQCLSVALWLVDESKQRATLAASTFLSESKARELMLSPEQAAVVFAHFHRWPEPADIEHSGEEYAFLLRQMHPSEFPTREHRAAAPLMVRGELVGMLVLGDRIGGIALATQDFDMLRCVSEHATASLLNLNLTETVLQAKQLEAFQTMAAFFVHDLKNAASTLSLTLKNLPVHFEDISFREDALRGLAKSAGHINNLVGRLSSLRQQLNIQPARHDLNQVLTSALASLEVEPEFEVVKHFAPQCEAWIDREQIAKVATNLVLNAKEAMGGKGRIEVSTLREGGWVTLVVEDHGCGMSPEYIERSLFRPFQTTKKYGLGIGVFQSKMIVELHGGRIAVASVPGVGTTFRVYLPAQSPG